MPTMAGWQASPGVELHQRVHEEALEPAHAVRGKQRAVVGAEEAALVHGGEIEEVPARLERA